MEITLKCKVYGRWEMGMGEQSLKLEEDTFFQAVKPKSEQMSKRNHHKLSPALPPGTKVGKLRPGGHMRLL